MNTLPWAKFNPGLAFHQRSGLLAVGGRSVHSTRTRGEADAVKVAADFMALAMADVLLNIGGSSFSGNAGALNAGVRRVAMSDGARFDPIRADEIEALRASLLEL